MGRNTSDRNGARQARSSVLTLDWFAIELETTQPGTAGGILLGPRGKPAFAIRAPVIRGDKVTYVVSSGRLSGRDPHRLLAGHLPDAWISAVVDPAGRLAARTSGPNSLIGGPASASAQEAIARAAEGFHEGMSIDGVPTVTAYRASMGLRLRTGQRL